MANIYTKTMREALQEARDYREPTDIDEGYPMSYDEWLKKEKGIKKGAHGINSDEHAKYSAEWRASVGKHYDNLPPLKKESNLDEIVGGRGEMTVTKDGGVMIIKTKDWQTYKAKGWNKKEEVEEKFRWQDILKKKGNVKVGKTDKQGNWHSVSTSDKKELEKLKSQGYEIVDEELEEDCGCGHGSDCGCPSDCDCGCNAVNNEKLDEAWNEKLSIKALGEYRKVYNMMKKTGVRPEFIKRMEKFYDDLVIGGMYTSRGAEEKGIVHIDGKTKYKNANW